MIQGHTRSGVLEKWMTLCSLRQIRIRAYQAVDVSKGQWITLAVTHCSTPQAIDCKNMRGFGCRCEAGRAIRAELRLCKSRGTCLEDIGDSSGILRRLSGRGDDGNGRPRHGGCLVLRVSTLC
jgi:hypothetical protein